MRISNLICIWVIVTNKNIHFAEQQEENPIRIIAVKNTIKFCPGNRVYMLKSGDFVKRRGRYFLGYVLSTDEEDNPIESFAKLKLNKILLEDISF